MTTLFAIVWIQLFLCSVFAPGKKSKKQLGDKHVRRHTVFIQQPTFHRANYRVCKVV